MILKSLWKIASGAECLWIDQVKAKYLPRSKLWTSKRTYNCSTFWRYIMGLREKLIPFIHWSIGDGASVTVFGQPWFSGALLFNCPPGQSSNMTLKELAVLQGSWDSDKLIEFFGHQTCMQIIGSISPPNDQAGDDRLLFKPSPNGQFSVKRLYNHLRDATMGPQIGHKELWRAIWKKGNVAQRVRLFVWKLVFNGLPLAKNNIFSNLQGDPLCSTCQQGEEDPKHLLLNCPFARLCWFTGSLALKTDLLPQNLDLQTILLQSLSFVNDEQWTEMMNSCWAIWRCRNDMAYSGVQPTLEKFRKYLQQIDLESTMLATLKGPTPICSRGQGLTQAEEASHNGYTSWVDGSWQQQWLGGIGIILNSKGELIEAKSEGINACCAIQAEAMALWMATLMVIDKGIISCAFYTDCQILSEAVNALKPPLQVDWRSFKEVLEIWKLFKKFKGFSCQHISRCHNEMADLLARKGTSERWSFQGFTYPLLLP